VGGKSVFLLSQSGTTKRIEGFRTVNLYSAAGQLEKKYLLVKPGAAVPQPKPATPTSKPTSGQVAKTPPTNTGKTKKGFGGVTVAVKSTVPAKGAQIAAKKPAAKVSAKAADAFFGKHS
jgi:hypothetical protein